MEAKIKMSLAEKLVTLRKQKGLTQMDLAELLNVSRQAISRWEVGGAVPSTDNLRFLGDLYGVQIDYLLNDDAEYDLNYPETTETKQDDQKDVRKSNRYKGLLVLIMIILGFIAIVTGVLNHEKQEWDYLVPIEDMTIEDGGDNYLEVTFPFE